MPKLTKTAECPLAKYNVEADAGMHCEKFGTGGMDAYEEELFAVCACCEYTDEVKEINGCYVLDRKDEIFYDHCLDCPVHMELESISEMKAEAAMS